MEGMVKAILSEYGVSWAVNRALYSAKLRSLRMAPAADKLFEKKTSYPVRLDLFQIDVIELKRFLYSLSREDKEQLIRTADNACSGIITGFSSIDLNYGDPIDWQFNPLTGKRCSEKEKWYSIPDFDPERGDIKVIWEASRFCHFITFARAFLLTGDKKYYKAFSEQLKNWLEKNPYGFGANFKCGQECSIRMVNALLAYTVFKESGAATDTDTSNVQNLIDRCYRKVLSNFFYAYKCIKNNHTISELMGMIVGAWCCEETDRLEKGFKLLDEVIDEQFTSDGGYTQFSFNYERLALQDLECILSIQDKVGYKLQNHEKIKNAALLMYQCQDESRDMPNYGANDGALIFPVTSCGYRDFRPVINTIYALTTGKQLYYDGKHQEELIWFNVKDSRTEEVKRVSSAFPEAGLFTIRYNNSWAMVILNDYHSRPAHMDQQHFDLWIDGINVFCDAGTYSYASDIGKTLMKTEGHNTVKAEGMEQMHQQGPFMIYGWTKRMGRRISQSTFEGIMKSGYVHKRKVVFSEGTYHITDKVNADYQILFHTPCEVNVVGNKATLLYNGTTLCELISDGSIQVKKSCRSLYYLQKEEINCISIIGNNGKTINTEIIIKGVKSKND